MHVGLLNDRGEGLLGGATRLQERGQVRTLPELRDRQVNPPSPGLPAPLSIAIAVREPVGAAGARRRSRPGFHLQVHHPLGRKGQQLTHKVTIRTLIDQFDQRQPVIGHRRLLLQVQLRNPTLAEDRR